MKEKKHSYHFECMKIPFVHLLRAEYKLDFVFQWKLPTPNELNCKKMVLVEYNFRAFCLNDKCNASIHSSFLS